MEQQLSDLNQIDLLISPRFLLFSASLCVDAVRVCNREQPDPPLRIRLLSEQGGAIPASNGIPLHTEKLDNHKAGTVVLLTSYEPEVACTPVIFNWLRQQQQQGSRMVCIETAVYVFAKAGLFQHVSQGHLKKLAAHYEAAPVYRELFGEQISLDRLYSHEDNLYSSAGAMSTLDLMLNLIEELRSKALADRVAYVFNHNRTPDDERKPARVEGAITRLDKRLGRMVALMQSSLTQPLPLAMIYQQAGVEASTARRLFQRIFRQRPSTYYRRLRLQYCREMLQNSGLSVAQVAELTGFADGSSFSRAYRQVFGASPVRAAKEQTGTDLLKNKPGQIY